MDETLNNSFGAPADPTLTCHSALPPAPPGTERPAAGRYVLGEEIARGGMGIVYRATDTTFDRPVAIKVLLRGGSSSGAARRFADEARITGQLQHPAIPPVHDLGTLPDGTPFLAMKLIKGNTLERLLKDRPDPAAGRGRLVAAFEQICQAVAYAHDHRVIHRDLKPANVMVGGFGEVQVMDWGLAKVLDAKEANAANPEATAAGTLVRSIRDSDDDQTQAGSVLGTPAFMPPEQALGSVGKVDARSDVFGLGGILAAILTGQPPFASGSVETTRIKAAQGKVEECFARLDASGGDPELVALCKRCLAPEPDGRPANGGEVAEAVAALRQAADERARQAELDRVRAEEGRKRRRLQLILWAAGLVLFATVGVAATVIFLWHNAVRARGTAQIAQGDAEVARDAEKTARAETEAARERLARVEYGRTMQVAYQEWRDNNAGATVALLASTRPDLRGWEYHYLNGLCNSNLLTLRGDTQEITSTSFTPDGSRVVTASWDGTARVWDASTGANLLTFKVHETRKGLALVSPGGTHIFASTQGGFHAWDARTGSEISLATFDPGSLNFFGGRPHFSPDGSRILAKKKNEPPQISDAKTGVKLIGLDEPKGWDPVRMAVSVAFSRDGSKVIAGSQDFPSRTGGIWVWDTHTGAIVFELTEHLPAVYSVAFSPDGARAVVGGWDRTSGLGVVRVLDTKTGAEVLDLRGHVRTVTSAAYSADGSRIVTASRDGTARIWDATTGAELVILKGHAGEVLSAAFNPDGMRIVTASADGTARLWETTTNTEVVTLKGHTSDVDGGAFSPDGARVVTASMDETIRVWAPRSGKELRVFSMNDGDGNISMYWHTFSFDGSRALISRWEVGTDNPVKVIDTNTGAELLKLKGFTDRAYFAAFSPDGTRIVTGNVVNFDGKKKEHDSKFRVWDAKTAVEISSFSARDLIPAVSAISPDGTRIVTTGDVHKRACVRDLKTGSELLTVKLNCNFAYATAYSPDGTRFITGEDGGRSTVWNAQTGAEVLALKGPLGYVASVSFSPDGSRIVTAGSDATTRIWDSKTGVEVMTLKGHTNTVVKASFSPDGTQILTCSVDGTARIWGVRPVKPTAP